MKIYIMLTSATICCVVFACSQNKNSDKQISEKTDDNIVISFDTIIDARDMQIYKTVKIGNQVWMAENLNVGIRVNSINLALEVDRDSLLNRTDEEKIEAFFTDVDHSLLTQTDNDTIEKYCYNDNAADCGVYGGLYLWDEMMQYAPSDNGEIGTTQGICPDGWHIPTDNEWMTLEMSLGMSSSEVKKTDWRGTDEGGKLKETGTEHWMSPNTGASNESGFAGLPGGLRYSHNGKTTTLFYNASFWSSTESDNTYPWHRGLAYDGTVMCRDRGEKDRGRSVRCVKD